MERHQPLSRRFGFRDSSFFRHSSFAIRISVCVAAGLAAEATEQDATNHWSFQPVRRPAIPIARVAHHAPRNPIDNFVAAKLAEHQLEPSPEADRQTLIRRLYFDLIGLPPTPWARTRPLVFWSPGRGTR